MPTGDAIAVNVSTGDLTYDSDIVAGGAQVPGTGATNLGKAEDAAHASGDTGVMVLAVREATATDLSAGATDGDYEPLQVDASGRLWVNPQGNVASGAADSGNPLKVGGKYNATLPTLTNGQRGDAQLDSSSRLIITGQQVVGEPAGGRPVTVGGVDSGNNSLALLVGSAGEAIVNVRASATGGYAYSHIATATTTTVKSGAGYLHAISVNSKGTVASAITVYDNTAGSGTVIGIIDSLNLSGAFILDVAFATGLTLVTTGTIAPDITVSYK